MTGREVPSLKEIYDRILSRSSLPLAGMEAHVRFRADARARRIYEYLMERADRLYDRKCLMCGGMARESQIRHAYGTPWDEEPRTLYFCSDDCGDSHMYEEPFAYFWCNGCDREVCEQNPMNGWHIQFRDYGDQKVCLRCYKDLILENGVERDRLEAGKIPGMFFDWGNKMALEAGYEPLEEFSDFFIDSQKRVDQFRKKALELMDEGLKVVIGYERMAITGTEGVVTLLVKGGGGGQD
ncbi:MAG: hypothetical protein AB1512_02820 [Thermodesulfobacteriota bacterium]